LNVIYDRRIQNDLRAALSYYDSEGGPALGDRFFAEAEHAIAKVLARPQTFHFAAPGLRRVALKSFPYHFLYEEKAGAIRFLVLRHDKRHPSFGLRRRL
jgi:toxin ParE1/3/4